MTSITPRTRTDKVSFTCPRITDAHTGEPYGSPFVYSPGTSTHSLIVSSGNPVNPKTGKRESGGPFYVVHKEVFSDPLEVSDIVTYDRSERYSGPIFGGYVPNFSGIASHHNSNPPMSFDSSSLDADGATAISLCAPTNPTASLGTTLAETFREGVPTLPGIQSWRNRTEILRAAGSEYLNYQFGWAPLLSEIHEVTNAARHHRDIMQNYRHNEGKNVHRRFDFDSEHSTWEEEISPGFPDFGPANGSRWWYEDENHPVAKRTNRVSFTRKKWFEGCFTYGGPSRTDSFGRALGFGTDADALFGIALSPDILWELTPWSWAVDWFSNAGDVINNVTNFALAGLVMRYGYMMEETISESYTEYGPHTRLGWHPGKGEYPIPVGSCRSGEKVITKSRAPANPFGFGIGWEDLSPTQLAITAAIGITRLL